MPSRSYFAVWEFHVKPESRLVFEKTYGPDGSWARLFRKSADFCGTQLLRDLGRPGRYLTVDHWTSCEALHQFKQAHRPEYDAFDQQCESLTDKESFLGEFESVSGLPLDFQVGPEKDSENKL
jgi:quinol monooxygenase YgiN